MKRLAALLALGLVACQQAATSPSAQIVGLRDMVRVGEFLFITSAERDELRVLDLVTGDTASPRRFVRAPNPIQALSIPVIRRPTVVTADVYYPPGSKTELAGPYVYATDPAVAQISIVWAENSDKVRGYTELTRLNTIGPVSAIAAAGRAPADPARPEHGTLYFATSGETSSTLFRVVLPQPADLKTGQRIEPLVAPIATRAGETVIDMVALPNDRLAITTRKASGAGVAEVIDGTTGRTIVPLQFPGPVRMLYTHPEFDLDDRGFLETFAAGTRVYGVLDEAACGSSACGGLVAVDAATGQRSLSRAGERLGPSVPLAQRIAPVLTFGDSLVQSVSFASNMPIVPPAGEPQDEVELSMIAVVSLSNGRVTLVRAAELRPLLTTTGPLAVVATDAGFYVAGENDAGIVGPEVSLRNGTFPADDVVTVRAEALPDGGTGAYVVTSALSGDIGRTGPDQQFTFAGSYYFHSGDYDPRVPALTLSMPKQAMAPGEQYQISISPNYLPLELTLSQTLCAAGFTSLPGTMVAVSDRAIGTPVYFVGYPSANAVVEVPYSVVRRASLLEAGGLLCWR